MATLALCAYCGRPSMISCKVCGSAICDRHLAHQAGGNICTSCAQGAMFE